MDEIYNVEEVRKLVVSYVVPGERACVVQDGSHPLVGGHQREGDLLTGDRVELGPVVGGDQPAARGPDQIPGADVGSYLHV